jgi:hypothetical protein
MTKGGKLSKAEVFYISQNPDNKTIHELASELDRSPKMVAKHYVEQQSEATEAAAQPAQPPVANSEAAMFKLMGRHERQGKHVATVMTRAASELADSTRPGRLKDKNKLSSAIHKPLS